MNSETTPPVDEAIPPVEAYPPPPVEAYPPPPIAPPTAPPPPSWQPDPGPRPRGRRFPWRTLAIGAAFLLAVVGMGLLYVDDTNNQATIRSLTTQNEGLNGRNQNLNDQVKSIQGTLTATIGELSDTKAALAHPHLVIWNVPQVVDNSDFYLAEGIPDTFTFHLVATSNGPMSVSILTLEDWAKAIECVDYGTGNTNYCMHHSGAVMTWTGVTSINYDFHLAEGCGDYMVVFTSASKVTVTPNVAVTYNPASSSTGSCV